MIVWSEKVYLWLDILKKYFNINIMKIQGEIENEFTQIIGVIFFFIIYIEKVNLLSYLQKNL